MTFWERVDMSGGPMACWPWTGGVSSTGYGTVCIDGRQCNAHWAAYVDAKGIPPSGHVVRHLCVDRSAKRITGGPMRERLCCNPAHLVAGTQAQNAADLTRHGRRKGRRL